MRGISVVCTLVSSLASQALAAGKGADGEGSGMLVSLFLSFCALMALSQVLPALKLVAGRLKGLFNRI